ncbi:MarR family winged helix-turn-helix transcriptional regulator [Candidatus Enterococcus ferrettii]|uniref:HTH marR-type domain-containing protein n=1 Tax=Candidatus Enterococcus ferrettii TaxID=2815324 RepID=A0ABV0EQG6_9ENTE|nr:MarR family transcriptional regulator [Enterococcus sp. 665A]MBO1341277.1 MarR family transcriptional regulator [Enterococcus sp. 665A]
MDSGYLLMNISKQLKYDLNQALIKNGVTVQQWAVIQQIHQRKESTVAELSFRLGMDKPTVSGIVKRLENKQLLKKRPNPSDQRSSLLLLTESGEAILKKCQKISEQILENSLSILSYEEQQTLNSLLTKVNQEKRKL